MHENSLNAIVRESYSPGAFGSHSSGVIQKQILTLFLKLGVKKLIMFSVETKVRQRLSHLPFNSRSISLLFRAKNIWTKDIKYVPFYRKTYCRRVTYFVGKPTQNDIY